MTHRERFLAALAHKEPDRVPLDIGGSIVTSMSAPVYPRLVSALGLVPRPTRVRNLYAQTAEMDPDVLEKLDIDTRSTDVFDPESYTFKEWEDDGKRYFEDEWGIVASFPLDGSASWYSTVGHPLKDASSVQDIKNYNWPDGGDQSRFKGLAEQCRHLAEVEQVGVIVETNIGGIYEWPSWLRGMENFMMDLAADPDMAQAVMEKIADFKCAYWESALSKAGKYVDLVRESDDLAGQSGLLISKEMYRKFMKPLHKRITDTIRKHSNARVCLHTCGAVKELIPDLMEAGFDTLNPVQVGTANMEPVALKKEFGRDLVFWGGGCDSQAVLPKATPEQVKQEARKNIEALMPGGGYVFASINLIQADVPAENVIAMVEAVREYGVY